MKKHKLIFLLLGTIAIGSYVYIGFSLENDLNGFYKGILFGWIIAAWVFFLSKKN